MQETICHYLLHKKSLPLSNIAVKYKVGSEWKSQNWQSYIQNIEYAAAGIKKIGIKKGDTVAIISNTRYEWSLLDMAILGIGGVVVPIYPSSTAEEIEFIINNSECKLAIIEDVTQMDKFDKIYSKCPSVKNTFLINPLNAKSKTPDLNEIIKSGKEEISRNPDLYSKSVDTVNLSDLATIHYTSGTTGVPKGVSLTHKQIVSEVSDVFSELGMVPNDLTLSFLPYSHVLGRVEHWGSIYLGYGMAYAESVDKIRDNLREVSPTVLVAVPRIFEKIYNGVVSQAEINPTKKKIFEWAVSVGREVSRHRRSKKMVPITLFAQYILANKLVFEKLQKGLGGKLRFAISGGAPLSSQIGEFFHAAGILILEGYGLTETTAAITLNRPHDYEFGTVGRPLADVKIKIADDGEILVKSDKVMREYFKNPTATNEVLKEGWFATGDIGEITDRGFIRITDRKKDLIKTAGGKYVAPQKLENLLKLNKYISNVLIHGDQKKYIVSLLTLNPDEVKRFASQNNIPFDSYAELVKTSEIQQLIRDVVAQVNGQLASYESIKNFDILPNDFTIENGELTPSMKVKRKFCDKKYQQIIDSLYA